VGVPVIPVVPAVKAASNSVAALGEGLLSPLDRYIHTGSGDSDFNCLSQKQVSNAQIVEMLWGREAREQYERGLKNALSAGGKELA